MKIKNFWYWCNLCEERFPVPVREVQPGWPTHTKCGQNSVSEDDIRFVWLDKQIEKKRLA